MKYEICTVEGCGRKPSGGRGLCVRHYHRWCNYGDPTGGGALRIIGDDEARFWSKVEKTEDCWEWTGWKHKGYGQFHRNGVDIGAHRISYEMANGPISDGMVIDHICHNPGCVNPKHLREATVKQNMENRAGAQSNNKSSGYRGVTRSDSGWIAQMKHNGQHIYIGYFALVEDAAEAARSKRNELFTHNNRDRD
ncbi:HNH endonuclease signature motif containing protein [Mycobacteroides saopaulense]|uniref:HNH endonuclease signature motif containing protein n=1 Tax=Mycobacteroides saopaulense TaxID=1578165 RepID=UPI001F2E8206|nr:HNH endonuclease signature motif containing protein [Mycobacteroides saopaulense]